MLDRGLADGVESPERREPGDRFPLAKWILATISWELPWVLLVLVGRAFRHVDRSASAMGIEWMVPVDLPMQKGPSGGAQTRPSLPPPGKWGCHRSSLLLCGGRLCAEETCP